MIKQKEIVLPGFRRGYHLIDNIIEEELKGILPETGILHVFIKHTSAAITLNENADYSVRIDFETVMNKLVPEAQAYYTHTTEGDDDMPAHIKASLIGNSISIPITHGRLNKGMWQGIYLCEFRNFGGSRKLVLTVYS
jgi:secondary thiamine-phosphate synthase enzyme